MAFSIVISISNRRLVLLKEGQPVKSYPVGVGRSGSPSPTGTFYIANKRPNPGGPYGAMWMGLSIPGYGIHGTNNPASIGGYVSKGCIRMYNKDVLELARIVPIGTPVIIRTY
ncbi:MAG: L,D-transpeptidase [Negativicutes bacterium]|nr:L,D-transpeptidase [Negativicutes bacterium]